MSYVHPPFMHAGEHCYSTNERVKASSGQHNSRESCALDDLHHRL
ncbi:unnamed protein product [Ixodes persulcatus]